MQKIPPRFHFNAKSSETIYVGKIDVDMQNFSYLQTASVWITGPNGLSNVHDTFRMLVVSRASSVET